MLDSLLQSDKELFLYLNGLGNTSWDGFWMGLSDKWTSIPIYLVLLFLSYKALGLKRTILLLATVGILITVTDQLSNFFKYGVRRLRPCFEADLQEQMRLVKGYCGGKFGFYSAHASNTMAVAVFFISLLGSRFRFLWPLLVLWSLAIAYSRVYIGVHYPLDILGGALAGLFIGWLFSRLYSLAVNKFNL
jgi:undecaprenyl-diphosphatase